MTAPACALLAVHGLPLVVVQALDDQELPDADRLIMYALSKRLDFVAYTEVYVLSLATETGRQERTVNNALLRLEARGYLDVKRNRRKGAAREIRFPWSRRRTGA